MELMLWMIMIMKEGGLCNMGKIIVACITITLLTFIAGLFPVVAVMLTAIVIVLAFLIFGSNY
jgi:hypothetical protein